MTGAPSVAAGPPPPTAAVLLPARATPAPARLALTAAAAVTTGGVVVTLLLLSTAPLLLVVLALLPLLGLVIAPVLSSPRLLLFALITMITTNLAEVVAGLAPVRLYLLTVLLAALGVCVAAVRGRLVLRWSPVLTAACVYLLARASSLPGAEDPAAGVATLVDEGQSVVVLALLVALLTPQLVRTSAGVAVGGLAALAALGVLQEFVVGNEVDFGGFAGVLSADLGGATGRHTGTLSDPNFWGRLLVLFTPVSLALLVTSRSRAQRAAWALAVGSLLLGIYLSQSRGALLAAAAAVAAWLLLLGGRYARLLLLSPLLLALVLLVPGVASRLGTLPGLGDPAPVTDGSVLQRAAVQRVGVAMALDRPLLGVGAGGFDSAQGSYARDLGLDLRPQAAHNLYLQMTAESGVVGLAGLLVLVGYGLHAGLSVLRRPPPEPAGARELAAGVVAGVVGWLVASVFLHLSEFDSLLLALALLSALRSAPRPAAATTVGVQARPHAPRPLALTAIGSLAGGVGLLISATFVSPPQWLGQQSLVVAPAGELPPHVERYAQDLLSRPNLLPTFAVMLTDHVRTVAPGVTVHVSVRQSGRAVPLLLSVRLVAPSSQSATVAAMAVDAHIGALFSGATGLYQLQRQSIRIEPQVDVGAVDVLLGAASGVCAVGVALVGPPRRRGRRPAARPVAPETMADA